MTRILLALLVAASLSLSGAASASMADMRRHAPAKEHNCTPPFPYSCTTVRWAVKTFSRSYLEEQGRKRGMNSCHKAVAEACIKGAP